MATINTSGILWYALSKIVFVETYPNKKFKTDKNGNTTN